MHLLHDSIHLRNKKIRLPIERLESRMLTQVALFGAISSFRALSIHSSPSP